MTTVRMFRSALHPEFVAYEIEPALVEAGYSTELAPVVAGLIDHFGHSVREAIVFLQEAERVGVLLADEVT